MAAHDLQCDEQLLKRYLETDMAPEEESSLEIHLEGCDACRKRLDELAAEAPWWSQASQYLRIDAWDGPKGLSTADTATYLRAAAERRTAEQIAARQIREWLDASDDPRMLGRFGGYEIVGMVGQGGMGVVLKGFEPSLNRYVAIKVLAPHLATSGAARKRFSREAQAVAAVLHENVIAIHRVAESRELPYLVMPYIAGASLQKRLDDEGPLALAAILRIAKQIAAGLATAHAQGLIHRDIKPANILLERGVERVTITDFGLARAVDDGSLTRSGVIAGTPQYMSPEQARGESLDPRSDLFSLGSVMYAMCVGHPPFRAETSYGVLRRITDTEPRPIREINPEIPGWLARLIARLHAKDPAERFQSAEELSNLLEQCLAHLQQPTLAPLPDVLAEPTAPRRFQRRMWVGLLAGAAFAVLAAAAVVMLRPEHPIESMQVLESANPGSASPLYETQASSSETLDADPVALSDSKIDGETQQLDRQLSDLERRSLQLWDATASSPSLPNQLVAPFAEQETKP